jgi:GT2 family glycosyltransferase
MTGFTYFAPPVQVQSPGCSVCIANYNGASLLGDCIDSILAQHCTFGVEIIVHDDKSTDESVALLRSHYPSVELLVSEDNVGFCASNNRMVNRARGEFVLLLNNDAALELGALQALYQRAVGAPDAVLTLAQYDWETGGLVDRGELLDPFYTPVPNMKPDRVHVAYVIGACLWVRRTVWADLGGLPEWMESIGEDMYFCLLARLRGMAVEVVVGGRYRHRQGASFGGNRISATGIRSTYRRRYLSERNRVSALAICTPTWLVWPWIMIHASFLCLEGILLTLMRRDRDIWRSVYGAALSSAWRRRAMLLRARREVQARRLVSLIAYLAAFTFVPRKIVMLLRHGLPTLSR